MTSSDMQDTPAGRWAARADGPRSSQPKRGSPCPHRYGQSNESWTRILVLKRRPRASPRSRVSLGGEKGVGGMRHCPFRRKILIFTSGREIPVASCRSAWLTAPSLLQLRAGLA
jgi:hypothetical protein